MFAVTERVERSHRFSPTSQFSKLITTPIGVTFFVDSIIQYVEQILVENIPTDLQSVVQDHLHHCSFFVTPGIFEIPTPKLKVLCSTSWATMSLFNLFCSIEQTRTMEYVWMTRLELAENFIPLGPQPSPLPITDYIHRRLRRTRTLTKKSGISYATITP